MEKEKRIALFTGTFDPFTIGHQNIVDRVLPLFDHLVIAVAVSKLKHTSEEIEARVAAIKAVYADEERVTVKSYDDLTVDMARREGAHFIVRGVRSVKDYEYEREQADVNRQLSGVETILLFADPSLSSISSSLERATLLWQRCRRMGGKTKTKIRKIRINKFNVMITYNTDGVAMPKLKKRIINRWIKQVAATYGRKVGDIGYMFVDDAKILQVNNEYLGHDYYTDIITFDYDEDNIVSGDLVISIDTVKSNAELFGKEYEDELHRVIIHGILHLCGINDKGPGEREIMEANENKALAMLKALEEKQ